MANQPKGAEQLVAEGKALCDAVDWAALLKQIGQQALPILIMGLVMWLMHYLIERE